MGWYYEHASKEDLIRELTRDYQGDGFNSRCLDYSLRGSTLWAVKETEAPESSFTYIACYLIGKSDGRWGYKPMAESMGPMYYDCPLRFLDMCEPPEQGYAKEWREKVRAWHAEQAA